MTRHRGKWISYLRVSTKRQGESGLGLEAQRAAVEAFLNGGNWQLVEEHVEVESGKHDHNRPALHRALERAVETEVVSRNVAAAVSPPKVEAAEIEILDAKQIAAAN